MLHYRELREPNELNIAVVKHWLISMVRSFCLQLRQANQNTQITVHQGTASKNGVRFIGQLCKLGQLWYKRENQVVIFP